MAPRSASSTSMASWLRGTINAPIVAGRYARAASIVRSASRWTRTAKRGCCSTTLSARTSSAHGTAGSSICGPAAIRAARALPCAKPDSRSPMGMSMSLSDQESGLMGVRSQEGGAAGSFLTPDSRPLNPDSYDWINRFAADLHVAARDLVRDGEASRVSDEAVARIMTAAIRLYVAKSDGEERTFRPIVRDDNEPLTATELLSAVSELLRALRLGPMELALWYRRRPDEP